MSLKHLADTLQSHGRGEDSMLVHMTPGEVHGLQKLAMAHGGSLTTNPQTGLPEAGFLSSILPTVAGIGLNLAFPGLGALGTAALVGGGTAALSGNLQKGLLAGLGAYGGSSLSEGLVKAGAGTAPAATAAAPTAAADMSLGAANSGLTTAGSGITALPQGVSPQVGQMASGAGQMGATPAVTRNALETAMAQPQLGMGGTQQASAGVGDTFMNRARQMGQGLEGLTTEAGRDRFIGAAPTTPGGKPTGMGGKGAALTAAGLAALPYLAEVPKGPKRPKEDDEGEVPKYRYDSGYSPRSNFGSTSEYDYFNPVFRPYARGGILAFAEGGDTQKVLQDANPTQSAMDYLMGSATGPNMTGASRDAANYLNNITQVSAPTQAAQYMAAHPKAPIKGNSSLQNVVDIGNAGTLTWDPATGQYKIKAAQGGVLGLAQGGMAKGGFVVPADVVSAMGNGSTDAGLRALHKQLGSVTPIKGPGDGLSDSIPTKIDGKQPARVADGEAYVSPETVAKLGGGDMKKGSQKLYAMMDRVRHAAHGKTTQQKPVNPKSTMA